MLRNNLSAVSNKVNSLEKSLHDSITMTIKKDIDSINTSISDLSSKLSTLLVPPATSPVRPAPGSSTQASPSIPPPTTREDHDTSRKYNIVVSGIAEAAKGTRRPDRLSQDKERAVAALSPLCPSLSLHSIRDVSRLGKYQESRNRPILLQFYSLGDVSVVLGNRSRLSSSPIFIRPDLPPSLRAARKELLKVRRSLILSGDADSKDIKVSKVSLFIRGVLHGKAPMRLFLPLLPTLLTPTL